jgi:hypothetical protein
MIRSCLLPHRYPLYLLPPSPSPLAGRPDLHRYVTALDVHPSRPNVCATGSSDGTVALWDLRYEAAPLAFALPAAGEDLHGPGGAVWEVRFDRCQDVARDAARGGPGPMRVLFCTEGGALGACEVDRFPPPGAAHAGKVGAAAAVAPREFPAGVAAVTSLDQDPVNGADMVVVTEQECLTYLRRKLF